MLHYRYIMTCGIQKVSLNIHIKDKLGNLQILENDQERRWVEHFSEVLDLPPHPEEPHISEPEHEIQIIIEQ